MKQVTAQTTAQAIEEMMAIWNRIEAKARQQFPGASEEQIYALTSSAMHWGLRAVTERQAKVTA